MLEVYSWPTPNGQKVHIALEELTFVRENETNKWVDLGAMTLGRKVAARRK